MPRVAGIDLGTVTTDVCGLDDGRVVLAESLPTAEAVSSPSALLRLLDSAAPFDLIVGPSGYGLPLRAGRDLTEEDLALAALAVEGEIGGIGGFRTLLRALAASPLPVVFTPGVIHLPSVPAHRKINRVDMGTADKVCAAALAVHQRARDTGSPETDVSLLLLEAGGAFSAALAVHNGAIVDGLGGTSGPIGMASSGAWDGEVAYLAGRVRKSRLFGGGAQSLAPALGWTAYVEGAVKALASLATSLPGVPEIVVSGRLAHDARLHEDLARGLAPVVGKPVLLALNGFTTGVKQGAQGAALVADGLAGGSAADLVRALRIREASGTVLDHLHVITTAEARERLGLP